MKKVGIVTILGDYNYGNRLQNYALHKTICDMGYDVETINFKYVDNTLKNKIKLFLRSIVVSLGIGRYNRNKQFKKFNKLIKFSTNIYNNTKISSNHYDYFICGSDQIWNYNFNEFGTNTLLGFSTKEKNIAYAASYGVSNIPEEYKEVYRTNLKNFKNISLRECDGQKLTEELTGKKYPVVLDPTFLICRSDWEKLLVEKKIKKEYILVYILGDHISDIEEIYGDKYEIVFMNEKNNKAIYNCGPYEFLGLIKNAKFIITDSYHACVFSIIFEKNFAILDRVVNKEKCMEGRINTVLKMLDLEYLKINCIDEIKKKNLLDYAVNYQQINILLDKERKKSMQYLIENLKW